jgi:RNA polymerase sigma factor (sigma-70 family)
LLKIAYGLLLDWDDAQDAMQLAFIALHRQLADLDATRPGAVRAYLITCARNAAFDMLRKDKLRTSISADISLDLEPAAPDPIVALVREAERAILRECIRQLQLKERLVVVLRFPGNLPDAEVWELLNEMGWSDADAAETLATEEGKKLREIADRTGKLGINTVGGVGNILQTAKRKLKECFEHDDQGTADRPRGPNHE